MYTRRAVYFTDRPCLWMRIGGLQSDVMTNPHLQGNRDREWGELATSVKLLHRNAKHLGAIYVVTPKGVRPTWLGSMPSVRTVARAPV